MEGTRAPVETLGRQHKRGEGDLRGGVDLGHENGRDPDGLAQKP